MKQTGIPITCAAAATFALLTAPHAAADINYEAMKAVCRPGSYVDTTGALYKNAIESGYCMSKGGGPLTILTYRSKAAATAELSTFPSNILLASYDFNDGGVLVFMPANFTGNEWTSYLIQALHFRGSTPPFVP